MNRSIVFAILTPTYNRPNQLCRAIESVQSQTYRDYLHIVINDSPHYDYSHTEKKISLDNKITYLKNTNNVGKNVSLNKALTHLKNISFSGYIIFLDDDDWLSPNCLETFEKKIANESNVVWFVSKRSLEHGKDLTQNVTSKKLISYQKDYLLLKKFYGDATHCIHASSALDSRFTQIIKTGEEWIYFCQIEKRSGLFSFIDSVGTLSEGYSLDGITKKYNPPTFGSIFKEVYSKKILTIFTLLYVLGRKIKHIARGV